MVNHEKNEVWQSLAPFNHCDHWGWYQTYGTPLSHFATLELFGAIFWIFTLVAVPNHRQLRVFNRRTQLIQSCQIADSAYK